MPAKLPAPLVGTAAQPGPKFSLVRLAWAVVGAVVESVAADLLSLPHAAALKAKPTARPTAARRIRGDRMGFS
jgi:hypothetical protein